MDLNDHSDVGSQSIDRADVATCERRPARTATAG